MNTPSTFEALFQKHTALVDAVQSEMGEKRFAHTLSVAKEALRLASEFSLSGKDTERLFLAALLHDITKARSFDEQIALADTLGVVLTKEDLASPPVLHALTGAAYAKQHFPALVDDGICEAIRTHTVGKADMTLFDKLLFLADYIEESRTHTVCQQTRRQFYQELASGHNKETTLDHTLLTILQNTASFVKDSGRALHSASLNTIESLSKKG